jgi:hypothetical protein
MEEIIRYTFHVCVLFLIWLGDLTGLGYYGINVLIFCVIWPIFTLWLIWVVFKQRKEIKKLKSENQVRAENS